jgi:dihydrodipicolinate synthase/N-acetylneuraminate lyase
VENGRKDFAHASPYNHCHFATHTNNTHTFFSLNAANCAAFGGTWEPATNTPPVNTEVPVITGTSVVGGELSATSGTWTDADGNTLTYTYKWYRADDNSGTNDAEIPGGITNTYNVTANDAHKYLRVVVTANDGHGSSDQTATSTRTAVTDTAPVNTVVPAISGAGTVGSLLTATSGTWTDSDGDTQSYTYQWYRADDNSGTNDAAISGATADSYTLTVSDAHKFLRVVVTANDGHGSADQTATSTRTALTNSAPVNTVVPAITGTTTIGSLLSATSGTWTDADGDTPTYSYQWYRADDNSGTNDTPIPSATADTYTLTVSDTHKFLRVVVTANDGHGSSDQTATSTRTAITNTAPVNTVVPAISGASTVGSLLSATSGTWTDADGDIPTYTYQWYRADDNSGTNEAAISGATADTYTLTVSDTHKFLRVVVTANDGHGSSDQTATSTRTAAANSAPVNTVVPVISGATTVGSLLSATSGTWTDADGDTPTYTYQWYRADDNTGTNDAPIPSATADNYTLTISDTHKFLRVVITANDGHGSSDQTATSTRTAVSNAAPVNTVVPAISGASTVGSLLTATSGTWTDADGDTPTYTYQWYRADDNSGTNDTPIPSATADTYTLTVSDTHKFLRVVVTANDGHGSSDQTATSTRTAAANSAPVNTVVPVISGTTTVGSLLSATSGTWTDADGDTPSFSYQWYRADDNSGTNEAAISGATADSYTLTASDTHKYLRIVVTANDGHGSSDQTATSTRTAVSNAAPVNTGVPVISGTNTVGSTLSATAGTWTDSDGDSPTYSYQWYRANDGSGAGEAAISGATINSYTLTTSDAHKYLRVIVTANDGHGSSDQTAASTRTALANTEPINTVIPVISGAAAVGSTLAVTTGTWTDTDGDTPTFTYQWKAANSPITNQISSTYLLTSAQSHKKITCTITADDGYDGKAIITTAEVPVANSAPAFTGTPAITGRAKVKQTLSLADTGTSDADGDTVTLSYQWAAAGVDIPGATLNTYQLTVNEDKKSITCTLTADDGNSGKTHYTTLGVDVKSGFPWCNLVPILIAPKETP